jgi:hypothetical protein
MDAKDLKEQQQCYRDWIRGRKNTNPNLLIPLETKLIPSKVYIPPKLKKEDEKLKIFRGCMIGSHVFEIGDIVSLLLSDKLQFGIVRFFFQEDEKLMWVCVTEVYYDEDSEFTPFPFRFGAEVNYDLIFLDINYNLRCGKLYPMESQVLV